MGLIIHDSVIGFVNSGFQDESGMSVGFSQVVAILT